MAIDEQKAGEAAGQAFGGPAAPAMSGLLYLGAIHFDGDPSELLPGYRRLLEKFPIEALDAHLCITRDKGLTIFDACPTKAIYEQFTKSDAFHGAVAQAGLPAPRIEGLGDVQVAHLRDEVRP